MSTKLLNSSMKLAEFTSPRPPITGESPVSGKKLKPNKTAKEVAGDKIKELKDK